MPFGVKPVCTSCKITSSPIWRKSSQGEVLCNSCGLKLVNGTSVAAISCPPVTALKVEGGSILKTNGGSKNTSSVVAASGMVATSNGAPVLRKSARIKPAKKSAQSSNKTLSTKGKGRRIVFKKNACHKLYRKNNCITHLPCYWKKKIAIVLFSYGCIAELSPEQPLKAPASVATVVTGESVFHKDQYYQAGDVVSLVDHDGGLFYAQLRGFLSDQYNEKSAVITWLLPTAHSPTNKFDPNTYILGPEEDLPRKMEYMEFICHAPSDYFRARDAPYKTITPDPKLCYIWTSIGPHIQTAPSIDEIFGISDGSSIGGGNVQGKLGREWNKNSQGLREKKTGQNRDKSKLRVLKQKYDDEKHSS